MRREGGYFRSMSRLKTSALGEKLPSVGTGLKRRACIAVAIALSTRLLASDLDSVGLRLIIVQMICPMVL